MATIIPGSITPTGMAIRIIYEDTGKDPAEDFNHAEIGGAMLIPDVVHDWDAVKFPANETCKDLMPLTGGPIIYPAQILSEVGYGISPLKHAQATMEEIEAGRRVFWLNGCFAYRTLGRIHRSGFCFFLRARYNKPIADWTFKSCPSGFSAS